ncbi:MOSC domain-containing protein [Pelagibacteraceae bacterium]|nr:MOSC domain-containing protein [Pelagibacteraceae bacterium]
MIKINKLYYSPVKSLSFSKAKTLTILKNIGIKYDRNFAFTNNLNEEKIKNIIKNPDKRKIFYFLSLKNYPELNQYNFDLNKNILKLNFQDNTILNTDLNKEEEIESLCRKMEKLFLNIKKINFVRDSKSPFFDTMPSKTISLLNLNSINDLEKKINQQIEYQRFRGNIYVDGMKSWIERDLINQIIIINNVRFRVLKEIPRCSATNIKPQSSNYDLNIPQMLKKNYNHINMGIYLLPIDDGIINIDDQILL